MQDRFSLDELTVEMMRLYTAGKYPQAFELVERHAGQFPEAGARLTLWKMCLLSLCGRPDEVLSVFQRGLDEGVWWADSQFQDPDLDAVRDLPGFRRLMAISREKYCEARKHARRDQTILLPDGPAPRAYPLFIALHGRSGNKDTDLEYWELARRKGWLVLSAQSTQPVSPNSYCWDDVDVAMADLLHYFGKVSEQYHIDPLRVVTAGFSQGGGLAVYAALSGKLPACGFIGVGAFFAEPGLLAPLAGRSGSLRGYFVVGGQDPSLENTRTIQGILKESGVRYLDEVFSDLGHAFPPDFGASLDKAVEFILRSSNG